LRAVREVTESQMEMLLLVLIAVAVVALIESGAVSEPGG
jgi:hypothetical protein